MVAKRRERQQRVGGLQNAAPFLPAGRDRGPRDPVLRSGARMAAAGRSPAPSLEMDPPKKPEPTGQFKCQLCGLTAPYTYYGQKPPNTRSIVILEDSYVMKDPFTPDKEKFLILGSLCSLCRRTVCVGAECSLFYTKRFCLPCVNENLQAFPLEIQEDMDKRMPKSKCSKRKKVDSRT